MSSIISFLTDFDVHVCSYQQLKAKWEAKNHEVRLINTRLEESGHHRLLTEIQELCDLIGQFKPHI